MSNSEWMSKIDVAMTIEEMSEKGTLTRAQELAAYEVIKNATKSTLFAFDGARVLIRLVRHPRSTEFAEWAGESYGPRSEWELNPVVAEKIRFHEAEARRHVALFGGCYGDGLSATQNNPNHGLGTGAMR